ETKSQATSGGIFVQEDREISYTADQLCNTRDGNRRIQLEVHNDVAYPYIFSFPATVIPDTVVDAFPLLISGVPAGAFEFTIRDSFGFEVTETIQVQEEIQPEFEVGIDHHRVLHPTCLNPFGGQIALNVTPEGPEYRFGLLQDEAEFFGDAVSGREVGEYVVEVEDQEGCVDTLHFTLGAQQELTVTGEEDALVLWPGEEEAILRIENDNPLYEG